MRRASPIILILAAVLGLAWVCAEAEAAPLRHPIKLGAKCQKSFEKFLNWPAYYKTFAYVVGRRGYACAMNEGRRAALEACNRQNKGRCEVYAQSPVDGGLKILWPARAKPRIRDDKGPSTRVGPCYEGPGTTISRLTARECRRRDGVIVERREHIQLCQRKRLQPAQCLELLEQNRPDGVRPRTAARDQRRPPDNGSIVVRNLPSKDAAAKAVRVREAAQASAAEKARQANLDKALTALRKQHKHAVAVIVGLGAGVTFNMVFVFINLEFFPMPAGVSMDDQDSFNAWLETLPDTAFLLPVVAHLAQAFGGGWIAARLCASRPLEMAMVIGGLSMIGGILNLNQIPHPGWMWGELPFYLLLAWVAGNIEVKRRAALA